MLGLIKHNAKTQTIRCPQCMAEQEVPLNAISTYCKDCRNRIDIKTIKQHGEKPHVRSWKPRTKTISCPLCHTLQEALSTALSAYCKNCHERIPLLETKDAFSDEPPINLEQRDITCPHCGKLQTVPSTALSAFCTECNNRINLQNYEIKGRFCGELETKGRIYIALDGEVEGNINTGTLIVAGGLKGEVIAEQKVELKSSAKLFGKIKTPCLVVSSGAVFVGQSVIGKS